MAAFENQHVHESRLRAIEALQQTENQIHVAATGRRQQLEAEPRLKKLLDTHPQFVDLDAARKFHYIMFIISIPCVYCIDVLLFSSIAQFLVQTTFPDSILLASIARYFVPAAIIGIELTIATHIYRGNEERREYGSSHSLPFWKAVGVSIVLSIVAGVVATVLAIINGGSGSFSTFGVMGIGLALLGGVAHIGLIFAGGLASDAKGFVAFSMQRRSFESEIRSYRAQFDRAIHAAASSFRRYLSILEIHNSSFTENRIQAGPFTKNARELLNEYFGYVVIQGPNDLDSDEKSSKQPKQNPSSPAPSNSEEANIVPKQQSNGDGYNSYLHAILQRRTQDDDKEVKL